MKNIKITSLLVGLGFVSSSVFAVSELSGEITENLDFPSGVLLTDTVLPEDQSAETGSSTVKLLGVGSVTVSTQQTGGFPKVRVGGGTTITSSRSFEKTDMKSWWEGQFTPPSTTKSPMPSEVDFPAIKNSTDDLQVISTFSWGLGNEEFSFSPAAQVLFPVDVLDNQQLFAAYYDNGQWTVGNDSCIVEGGLCYLEVAKMNRLAFVSRVYDTCPQGNIVNGEMGSAPSCIVTCDHNFELNSTGDACLASEVSENEEEEDQTLLSEGEYSGEENLDNYEYREGYFRYIGAREHRQRFLDESTAEGDALDTVRSLNRSYLMRHPRSAEEQIKKEVAVEDNNDSFMNYLLEMRSTFGEGSSGNDFDVYDEEVATESELEGELKEKPEDSEEETFHSSGKLLPSTGPELFVMIAIIGLFLMLFGARRRN